MLMSVWLQRRRRERRQLAMRNPQQVSQYLPPFGIVEQMILGAYGATTPGGPRVNRQLQLNTADCGRWIDRLGPADQHVIAGVPRQRRSFDLKPQPFTATLHPRDDAEQVMIDRPGRQLVIVDISVPFFVSSTAISQSCSKSLGKRFSVGLIAAASGLD